MSHVANIQQNVATVNKVTISLITKEQINEIWPQIEEWVISAIGEDKSIIAEDIKSLCEADNIRLWVIYNCELTGFLITSIYNAKRAKICYAPWLGGKNLADWVAPAFEQFKEYLRLEGCKQYSFIGRGAWQKLIKADYCANFYLINL